MSQPEENQSLCVVWSTSEKDTALSNVFMYTKNSRLRDWWPTVRLIVWGASVKALCADEDLQKGLKEVADAGVEIWACKACAEMYGLVDQLTDLGVEVVYTGQPLTNMLKSGWKVLTY